MPSSKALKYQELIKTVKESYPPYNANENKDSLRLYWYEECQEINLWTYWQGRNCLDAKIMLVGQDWGCPWDSASDKLMGKIHSANQGDSINYMDENESITDRHLIELFRSIGYNVLEPNPDLFFTNFILGYRNKGTSGGYSQHWCEHDKGFFRELSNIISPKVILCLGRATFDGTLAAFDKKEQINSYNRFIESEKNPVSITFDNGETAYVFALAHCGVMGTLNRNRGKKQRADDLTLQLQDWARVLPYIT